jgi:hypothetical protein
MSVLLDESRMEAMISSTSSTTKRHDTIDCSSSFASIRASCEECRPSYTTLATNRMMMLSARSYMDNLEKLPLNVLTENEQYMQPRRNRQVWGNSLKTSQTGLILLLLLMRTHTLFESVLAQETSSYVTRDTKYYGSSEDSTAVTSKFPLYYADSQNVLNNLDQFQALYVKYHSCV